MAGNVVNIKVCSPLKLRSGLAGNYHAICHYSYNLPLATIQINNLMKKSLIILICIIFVSCSFNKSEKKESVNSIKVQETIGLDNARIELSKSKDTIKTIQKNYSTHSIHDTVDFKNYNKVVRFYSNNDSLFCLTTEAIKYYCEDSDMWKLYEIKGYEYEKTYTKEDDSKFPKGYKHKGMWSTIWDKKKNYWSIHHTDEGRMYSEFDILDTISGDVFKFRNEMIHDFCVDSTSLWFGTGYGISRIDKFKKERYDYITLPAITNIVSYHEVDSIIYILDKHYGLYSYSKNSKQVLPVKKLNNIYQDNRYHFVNSCLIGESIYIIISEYSGCIVAKFQIRDSKIIKKKSNVDYFDSFCQHGDSLFVYGDYTSYYDGGEDNYGGAILYLLDCDSIVNLIRRPVSSLNLKMNKVTFLSISQTNGEACSIEEFELGTNYSLKSLRQNKFISSYQDTIQKGDSVLYWNGKKYYNDSDSLSFYLNTLDKLNKKRTYFSDSLIYTLPVDLIELRKESKEVENYNYKEEHVANSL